MITDIEKFSIVGFAKQYFSEHKKGIIFRRQVPIEEMLTYQSSSLKSPLMVLAPTLKKDACKCFKLIQKIMNPKTDLISRNAHVQLLIDKGIKHGGLRDEIFVQIIKQLKDNPNA